MKAVIIPSNHIQQSLQEVIKCASSYDLISPDSKVIGIMYPHHNIYRAFVTIDPQKSVPRQLDTIEIKSGKFAAFRLSACSQDAVDAASLFFL